MMTTQEYLKATWPLTLLPETKEQKLRPRVWCKDGFNISIQADKYTYCTPRENGNITYHEVELGYPSHPMPEFAEWGAGENGETPSIWAYVPVLVVDVLLRAHGGIDHWGYFPEGYFPVNGGVLKI